MSLEFAHERLGWPKPDEIRDPPGEGARIFARLAQSKIERAMKTQPDASGIRVGVLSPNPSSTQTEAPLAVVAEFPHLASEQTLRQLHRLAWNFSHSPSVVTLEPHLLRVWTCCEPPDDDRPFANYVVERMDTAELASPRPSEAGKRALQVLHWINLVSGQFFRDSASRFQRDHRADQSLLANLQYVREELRKGGLEDDDVCHDLLARIIFVQFLFDRKDSGGIAALNPNKLLALHQSGVLRNQHKDLSGILDDYNDTYRLFDWLNAKFNGDLFPGKGDSPREREYGWRQEKKIVGENHLRLLSDFIRGDLDMPTGQLCLWPQYAFDVIPLEFISSIYETFVKESARSKGIYYTPPNLVDFILDEVLPWDSVDWDLRVLDPTCGSGVFLVKAFQRLIHRWKKAHPGESIRVDTLRRLLERNVFGVDKDPHAVRVASFSLYLAMCDEIDPKYYWSQVRFPEMRGSRLINADFFEETWPGFNTREDAKSYHLVVGNAPWGKKVSTTQAAKDWAENPNHMWPVVNKGIGTLFLPKAAALTRPDGKIAMIQPASTLLFNRSPTAREFRRVFFTTFQVEAVVNLSALRFMVFSRKAKATRKSVAPTCFVVFKPKPPNEEKFAYISPKQTEDLVGGPKPVVEPADVKGIYPDQAAEDPAIWTTLLWGNQRDHQLVRRLLGFRRIEKNFPSNSTRRGIEFGDQKQYRPELSQRRILSHPNFPNNGLFHLHAAGLPSFDDPRIHSKDSTDFDAFTSPQLIIKRSWLKAAGRFQARLVDDSVREGVLCTQSYLTVHLPVERTEELEAACLSYNSVLATYFLLLTSGRFASYIPELLIEELLRVPIPETQPNILRGLRSPQDIDDRVRELFGFKDAEWVLVEDLLDITLPDFKGNLTSPGRKRTNRNNGSDEFELSRYSEYFVRVLKAGFGPDKRITTTVFQEAGNELLPYRLIVFEFDRDCNQEFNVESMETSELINALEDLNSTWMSRPTAHGSIFHQRVARLYLARHGIPTIFVIKPDQVRYWTRSLALHDADEVAADIVRWGTNMKRVD